MDPDGAQTSGGVVPPPVAQYAAGWYPDPTHRFELRYHNGTAWTGDVSNQGQRYVDPMEAALQAAGAHGPAGTTTRRNGVALAAMILGIVAVVTAWMPFLVVIGAICAIASIPFGIVGRRRAKRGAGRSSMATTGLVLGGLGVALSALGILLTVIVVQLMTPGRHEVTPVECQARAGRATFTGTITNLEDDTQNYVVVVRFYRGGTDSSLGDDMTSVQDVQAGESGTFSTGITTDVESVDCEVVEVLGGLPVAID